MDNKSGKELAAIIKAHKKFDINKYVFVVALLSIPIAHFLIFWLYVNIQSIMLAFQDQRTNAFTLQNFVSFWDTLTRGTGDGVGIALKNTMIYFLSGILIMMPLNLIVAFFFYKRIKFYKAFRIIFYLPAIISSVAMVASYTQFIDPNGPLGIIAKLFGVRIPPEGLLAIKGTATMTIVMYTIWTGFTTNVLLFGGAMSRIPIEVLESAKLEGCGPWREIRSIVFPLILPTFSTCLIFAFTGVFTASGPILLFWTEGSEMTTISFWIFKQVYGDGKVGGTGSYNLVSCAGLCFTLVGVPIILLLRRLLEKIDIAEF